MSKKLLTDNTAQLIYENDILELTVLGGIKLEGLDRMRVTVKIQEQESARPPVRHNLDLYNDNQLEKFIRKCAEKLEIGTSVISASLSELGYSGDTDPHSGHVDPSVDFGLKKILSDKITVFF